MNLSNTELSKVLSPLFIHSDEISGNLGGTNIVHCATMDDVCRATLMLPGNLGGTSIVDHSHYLIRRIVQKPLSAVADPSGTLWYRHNNLLVSRRVSFELCFSFKTSQIVETLVIFFRGTACCLLIVGLDVDRNLFQLVL